ncbi:BapA/Bap/LapF family large adhesin [Erwinia sp. PsM31]|uniref:BapA/Bap/LapF family large adhesin n=1 Tax=Erwinia sp. PsM31 TaxID=3030535 RepID=UPI00263B4C52|nr:BapA/Bap/LapF family large adhesin [Erwinia sp. PsM31]MDN4626834.1 Ig-like domain-containing protein [Erwinia sp. PsM31]
MNLQLIIKDVSGKVIARHDLIPQQPLSLKPPANASTFEVHSNDGNLPAQIKATKSNSGLRLTWADEATGENYEVLLDNYAPDVPPAVTASDPDGVVYAFDYDPASAVYELTDTSAELLTVGDNSVMLAAGGGIGAAALLIGIGVSNHSSGGGSSSDDNAASTVSPSIVLTDASGNILNSGDTISDSTLTLSGEGMAPGSTVVISDGGAVIGETTVDENGRWSFTPNEALADGGHTIVVDGTDINGNGVSDSVDVVVDAQSNTETENGGEDGVIDPENILDEDIPAPEGIVPVVVIADDSGNIINSGEATRDSTPTFSGSNYQPGGTVTIANGDALLGEAVVEANGSWTFTPEALPEGAHTITVIGPDINGVSSSNSVDLVIDVTAPEGVDTAGVVITDEAGNAIDPGSASSDPTPTFSGDGAEPGSTVVVSDGGEVVGETTVNEDGSWSYTPDEPLAEGDHDISFEIIDEAGNGSGPSDSIDYTVDTTAPDVPDASAVVITDPDGNAIDPSGATSATTPTFSGDGAEPGATIVVSDGETAIGEATVAEDGSWSFTPEEPLAEGDHDISFEIIDEAGNGSGPSDSVGYTVDTTAPDVPDASAVVITDPDGAAIDPSGATSATTPTFSGSAEPGATVVVSDGDVALGETTVNEDGSWSFTPDEPLAEGDHDISFEIIDEAGNGSGPSDSIDYTVDTTAPDVPDASAVVITDPDGTAIDPSGATSATTPTFSGNGAEPGATVVVSDGDVALGETTVNEDGSWSYTPDEPLAEGEHSFSFEAVDEAGNTSGASAPIDYIVDITAPESIDTSLVIITNPAGIAIDPSGATSVTTPTFNGDIAEPGCTVVVSDGGEVVGKTTVNEDGSWSLTPDQPLAEGDHSFSFEVVDGAGNTSGASAPIDYTVDTTAPEGIETPAVIITNPDGTAIDSASATSATTPTFSGSAEPGATVIISDGDTALGETTVSEDGSWSFTPDQPLAEGDHDISFEVIDEAGNTSGASAAIDYTVDTIAPEGIDPASIVITDEAGIVVDRTETLTDSKATFSGSAEPGATVTLYDKGEKVGEATVAEDGSWQFTDEDGLYDGSHELTFTVTDGAGNSSAPSATLNLDVQAVILTAMDNISAEAAVGFTYPVSVEDDLGTLISDSGLIAINNTIVSDAIVVADGTFIDLNVTATSSAFLNVASNSTLILQKYHSATGEWVDVSQGGSSNLFGLFGSGANTATLTLSGLTAGTYQLVYTTAGINIGASFDLEARETVYTLAEEATTTDYTTAAGNVMSDADGIYGPDTIPHGASTLVSSVSVTNSDGHVTKVTLGAITKTTLVGQYGMLMIGGDGSYEYIPAVSMNSIGKVEVFTYTLTDSATGKTSSAQLYIQIGSTNDALTLSWDATDPSADAVTDIASANAADASVAVSWRTTEASDTDVVLTTGGTVNYTSAFTLVSADDRVSGRLTLKTGQGLFGNDFATEKNIAYELQQLGSDGSWTTVTTDNLVVPAGDHNGEVLLTLDISTLVEEAGTWRLAIVTTGADNDVILDMAVSVTSTTDYEITASQAASGNLLTDEGIDGAIDKLSSIYTRLYAKAGDGSADTDVDSSYVAVTESGITLVGEYGTLLLYSDGTYLYTPDATTLPSGSQDIFTYALQGVNGKVVTATLTVNLGVEVDGSNGGALVFQGTEANDVFAVYDTDFAQMDGADGSDTLAWYGKAELVLSDVAARVSNIETLALAAESSGSVVVTAQDVVDITNDVNTLTVTGAAGDTVTLVGSWINSGTTVINSVLYTHYTGTTGAGVAVDLNVQQSVALSAAGYQDSSSGSEYDVVAAEAITGTDGNDLFNVDGSDFASIDGGAGLDTLVWRASTLTVSEIADKVSNIEEIELAADAGNLLISAQNVADITDDDNTLYVKGEAGDTLTLGGSWQWIGSEVLNNASYDRYVSTAADGQSVTLLVDSEIAFSATETAAENNAADVTGQVTLLSDSVAQTVTVEEESNSFISDSFVIASSSDQQAIGFSVSGASIDADNSVSATWSLQRYNGQTFAWETVTGGSQALTSSSALNVTLSDQPVGTYRLTIDTTQSGHTSLLLLTVYDELAIEVAVNIVSTTDYQVTADASSAGSVFTSDNGLIVKSIAAGIVTGAASYTLVAAAGTTIVGEYGSLTIHSDGSYTYTLASGSTIPLASSEDAFTYLLSDGTTQTLTVTPGVAVDGLGGGALTFEGTVGDDSFAIYDTQLTVLDGKAGHDTLVWRGEGELRLSDLAGKVSNIEAIDLQDNGAAAVLTLNVDDIASVTGDGNALYVRGGSEDSLSLADEWLVSGVETLNNIVYTLYTSATLNGTTIKLYVQEGITFNEVTAGIEGSLSAEEMQDLTLVSVSQNGETAVVDGEAASLQGYWGTLAIDGAGHYRYVPDEAAAQSGHTDTFTYTLSDGSSASLSVSLGVTVDGSAGGALTFSGSGGSDIFQLYDTDFTSINGADGSDTLAWHGSGSLDLSAISARVSNIEAVDLLDNSVNDSLTVSAESLFNITDDNNTLYVRGAEGDTVTLNGSWTQSTALLADGISYEHYTSTAADGSLVQLYIEDDIVIG